MTDIKTARKMMIAANEEFSFLLENLHETSGPASTALKQEARKMHIERNTPFSFIASVLRNVDLSSLNEEGNEAFQDCLSYEICNYFHGLAIIAQHKKEQGEPWDFPDECQKHIINSNTTRQRETGASPGLVEICNNAFTILSSQFEEEYALHGTGSIANHLEKIKENTL